MKTVWDIRDFGAAADGTLQTSAIQAAIDACFAAGGGEVVVPAGEYLVGTIRLRSHITLHLLTGAVLLGSRNLDDYAHFTEDAVEPIEIHEEPNYAGHPITNPWFRSILRVYHAEDVKIIGDPDSFVDGQNCFDPDGEEHYRGPHAINFFRCRNLEFSGYTVRNSANWAHILYECQNVHFHAIRVLAGHDGIHCRVCDHLRIEDCEIHSGDDCIAGYDNQDVIVRRCLLSGACSALRFGGTDVLLDHCHGKAPVQYGFRGSLSAEEKAAGAPTNETHRHTMLTVFQYFCGKPIRIRKRPGNITIQNCKFENPISVFRLLFDGRLWCCNRNLGSVTFRNCKFTGVTACIDLFSGTEEPTDFCMENVEIQPAAGYEEMEFIRAKNFDKIRLNHVTLKNFRQPVIVVASPGESRKIEVLDSTPVSVFVDPAVKTTNPAQ